MRCQQQFQNLEESFGLIRFVSLQSRAPLPKGLLPPIGDDAKALLEDLRRTRLGFGLRTAKFCKEKVVDAVQIRANLVDIHFPS